MILPERDLERKKNLEALYNRPPEAIKEENFLFHELKRRELHERKWAQERDYLVKILSNHELPVPMPLPTIPGSVPSGAFDNRQKKKRPTDGAGVGGGGDPRRRAPLVSQDSSSALARKDLPQGVFLRGHRLLMPRASNIQAKFKEMLDEYGLATPPNYPNVAVCDVADEVRGNVMVLMDIKKSIERIDHDMAILRERRRALMSGEVLPNHSKMGGMMESAESGDEYDEAEARRRKKSGGGGNSGMFKKARLH
ncbi:UNVERIFIED_CONTAM: swr complex subunit [Siphonaria sp. JEL0065]|nr:swr complex subunit [Siphonaria sp. JEL0065]